MSRSNELDLGGAVWNRTGSNEVSRNLFMLTMGACTVFGLLITAALAYYSTGWMHYIPPASESAKGTFQWVGPMPYLIFWLLVLSSSLAGVFISLGSEKPHVSLFGYMLVAAPFGLLLGPYVSMYENVSVVKVIFVTGGVTAVLSLIGTIIPDSLEGFGGWLFGGLCILLLGSFGIPLAGWLIPGFPIKEAMTMMDWFGVIIFSGYIIFDMNRAMRVPATIDNAVDCALALYLDVINLFIRLLAIMGKKKR